MSQVKTSQYENSHGKKPRGHGLWAFLLGNGQTVSESGTYGEVKKQCQVHAKNWGTYVKEVLP